MQFKQLQITVNPLWLTRPGDLFISNTFGGGLIQTGGLFNLAKVVVSALHKKTRMQIGKLKYKKLEVMQPRVKNKSELPTRE